VTNKNVAVAAESPFAEGDRIPRAEVGPELELLAVGRSLDDLSPDGAAGHRPAGVRSTSPLLELG
jgi:hypothetical protein